MKSAGEEAVLSERTAFGVAVTDVCAGLGRGRGRVAGDWPAGDDGAGPAANSASCRPKKQQPETLSRNELSFPSNAWKVRWVPRILAKCAKKGGRRSGRGGARTLSLPARDNPGPSTRQGTRAADGGRGAAGPSAQGPSGAGPRRGGTGRGPGEARVRGRGGPGSEDPGSRGDARRRGRRGRWDARHEVPKARQTPRGQPERKWAAASPVRREPQETRGGGKRPGSAGPRQPPARNAHTRDTGGSRARGAVAEPRGPPDASRREGRGRLRPPPRSRRRTGRTAREPGSGCAPAAGRAAPPGPHWPGARSEGRPSPAGGPGAAGTQRSLRGVRAPARDARGTRRSEAGPAGVRPRRKVRGATATRPRRPGATDSEPQPRSHRPGAADPEPQTGAGVGAERTCHRAALGFGRFRDFPEEPSWAAPVPEKGRAQGRRYGQPPSREPGPRPAPARPHDAGPRPSRPPGRPQARLPPPPRPKPPASSSAQAPGGGPLPPPHRSPAPPPGLTSPGCAARRVTSLRPAFRKEAPVADHGDGGGAVGSGGDGPGALRGEPERPSDSRPRRALGGRRVPGEARCVPRRPRRLRLDGLAGRLGRAREPRVALGAGKETGGGRGAEAALGAPERGRAAGRGGEAAWASSVRRPRGADGGRGRVPERLLRWARAGPAAAGRDAGSSPLPARPLLPRERGLPAGSGPRRARLPEGPAAAAASGAAEPRLGASARPTGVRRAPPPGPGAFLAVPAGWVRRPPASLGAGAGQGPELGTALPASAPGGCAGDGGGAGEAPGTGGGAPGPGPRILGLLDAAAPRGTSRNPENRLTEPM